MEGLGNLRVHLDEELLLLRQLFVASRDLVLDPAAEGGTENGVGDVDQPLARHLVHVAVLGEVVVDSWVLSGSLEDAFDAEVLVLWNVEDLNVVALDAKEGSVTRRYTYNFFLPITMSLRK